METVYLYDDVILSRRKQPGIEIESNLYFLPTDENNIAHKAAKLLMEEFHLDGGISIELRKHIPVSAGMAGGSTNAAAVLFGMNKMYRLGLTDEQLMARGVKLGADVPYCIMRGTVLAEGIGEQLTPLPPMPKCHLLLAKPGVSVSTRWVYERIDQKDNLKHPDIDGIINGLGNGDLREIAGAMGNVLEQVTVEAYPVIEEIKNCMKAAGALNAIMSGSGPTVFGIFERRSDAKAAYLQIKERQLAKQAYVTNVHSVKRR